MSSATASLAVDINKSVMPPRAETTTTLRPGVSSTIFFTFLRLSTVPTEVPPNFITFIAAAIKIK